MPHLPHDSRVEKAHYLALFSFKHWLVNIARKQWVGEVVEVSDCLKGFLCETPSYGPVSVYAAEQEKSSILWDVPLLPQAPHSNEVGFSPHSWGHKDGHALETDTDSFTLGSKPMVLDCVGQSRGVWWEAGTRRRRKTQKVHVTHLGLLSHYFPSSSAARQQPSQLYNQKTPLNQVINWRLGTVAQLPSAY